MIIPSGFAQVNLIFVGDNLPTGAQVTFGVDNNLNKDADTIGTEMIGLINTAALMDEFVDDEAITTIHVKKGPNATGAFADVAANIPGEVTSTGVSSAVAVLIKKNTSLGGRQGVGRMFWPGPAEGSVGSDGTLEGAYLTALAGVFGDWLVDLDANNTPMVLLHNDATTPTPVLSLAPQAIVATQRRRQRR